MCPALRQSARKKKIKDKNNKENTAAKGKV